MQEATVYEMKAVLLSERSAPNKKGAGTDYYYGFTADNLQFQLRGKESLSAKLSSPQDNEFKVGTLKFRFAVFNSALYPQFVSFELGK